MTSRALGLDAGSRVRLREVISFLPVGPDVVRLYEFGGPPLHVKGDVDETISVLRQLDGTRSLSEIARQGDHPLDGERGILELARHLIDRRMAVVEDDPGSSEPDARLDRQEAFLEAYAPSAAERRKVGKRLRGARVAVLGAGGAGGFIAHALAASGVGFLRIVDDDRVALSDLNRHPLFGREDIGRRKVEVIQERLARIDPDISFDTHVGRVASAEEAGALVDGMDVVVSTADSPPVVLRRLVNDAALRAGVACLFLGGWRVGPFVMPGETSCWHCMEERARHEDPSWDRMIERFVFPQRPPSIVSVPGVAASLAAFEVWKHLTGVMPPSSRSAVIIMDPVTLATTRFEVEGPCPHVPRP